MPEISRFIGCDRMNQDVIEVECLGGTRVRLTFEGGEVRDVDVSTLTPFDGVFAPLRDQEYFRRVRVNTDVGTIVWPNGADFCPDVLYERSTPAASAGDSRKRGRAV